jgi:hypothetical protein
MNTAGYEADFYGWANEQAALLRAGRLSDADIANIAAEIESMGRGEKRELVNRLAVLLLHLLKWQFQPARRGSGWLRTIREQRRRIQRHLADNPSLTAKLAEAITAGYGDALIGAGDETGLAESVFPTQCPWSFEQIADDGYFPSP